MAFLSEANRRTQRAPSRRLPWLSAFSVLFSALLLAADEPAHPNKENQVKAVLLYHLSQFVEWPQSAFESPDAPFVIGILGEDPFGKILDDVVGGEKAAGRPIIVQRCRKVDEAKKCQLLFVGASEKDDLRSIVARLKEQPVLIVTDWQGSIRRGAMVRLDRNTEGKIRLQINLDAAKTCGLKMSSKLIRVAEILRPEDD